MPLTIEKLREMLSLRFERLKEKSFGKYDEVDENEEHALATTCYKRKCNKCGMWVLKQESAKAKSEKLRVKMRVKIQQAANLTEYQPNRNVSIVTRKDIKCINVH
jgi:hypothetical protein